MKPKTQIGVMDDGTNVKGGIHFGDKIYKIVQPQEVDQTTLIQAHRLLSEMPAEDVPEPIILPQG